MQLMNSTVIILAWYYARRDVKADIQRRMGTSALRYIEGCQLRRLAQAWFDSHPELSEQAVETVRKVPQLRTLAEREERNRKRNRP